METLRQLAEIPDERFNGSTGWVTYVHARALASTRTSTFQRLGTGESELERRLGALENEVSGNGDVTASLTLLSLARDRDEKILMTKGVFMGVFRQFGIGPRFLQLVRTNRYGLHYDWDDGQRVSYYIGTALYILMWSFDRATRKTRAILLSRDFLSTDDLGSLRRLLRLEIDRLHSPFLLAWVSLVHLSNWMDSSTYYLLTTIRQLEELTGYGPYGRQKKSEDDGVPIDGLTQVNLANQLRHVTIGSAICSHIATRAAKLADYAVDPYADVCRRELDEFSATIPSLQRSLNDSSAYVYYLQERVRSQNTVVYALITHEDARINIGLAKASKELAEAAKKDSSSMKSIAIMTMLFLPGTYFAALWASPTLKWDEPNVIQTNFWWYWAFTLPSTIFIFAVWFGLHRWGSRWSRKPRPGGRGNEGYEVLEGGVTPPRTEPNYGYTLPPPVAAAKPPEKTHQPVGSAPPIHEPQGYSAPPEDPASAHADFPWFPQTYALGIPELTDIALPPEIEVRDYATRPHPTSAPMGYS